KAGERKEIALLLLRSARGLELRLELLVALRIAAMRQDGDERGGKIAVDGARVALKPRIDLGGAVSNLGILSDRAQGSEQDAAQLAFEFAFVVPGFPSQPRGGGAHDLADGGGKRGAVGIGSDQVEVVEGAD